MKNKYLSPLLMLFWLELILIGFYVVQKPDFMQIRGGLANLFGILLLPLWMTILSAALGSALLPACSAAERLILGAAAGLTLFGLAGFGLAISGLAKPPLLAAALLLLTALFFFNGRLAQLRADFNSLAAELTESAQSAPGWILLALAAAFSLAFVMSLAPPADDFDALLYHLAVPALWLRHGKLIPSPDVTYWYPHVVEGSFVFPLAFGFDTSAHLIHFLWLTLTMLLLWQWIRRAWNDSIAWNALALLLTMPSLLWLAAWAYTDYPLTFGGIAALYSIWRWSETKDARWVACGGVMTGLALGAKYSSVVVPLAALALIFVWEKENRARIKNGLIFSAVSLLVASPWFLRNWLWTGNPVFPAVFGGRFWDSFLARHFPASTPGIGFDPLQLLLLPLTATLGFRDMNFFDGRFGPFFLILLPLALWAHWKFRPAAQEQRRALLALSLFGLAGIALWVLGVVKSERFFQARYLFPALIPLTAPLAAALNRLTQLDAPRLKVSFVFRFMLALTVFINLLNFGLQTLARNPLAVPLGIVSREEYLQRAQPNYAAALRLTKRLSPDNSLYLLFEPRSYGMNVATQPDILNLNFLHDLWLYKTPQAVAAAWRARGYNYALLSRPGARFILADHPQEAALLEQTLSLLVRAAASPDGNFVLYRIR